MDFAIVYQKHHREITSFIGRRCPTDEAEDIASEVFFKALRAWPQYQEQGKLEAWLYRIARNKLKDYYRDRRPTEPVTSEPTTTDTYNTIDILDRLTPKQRAVMWLRYVEDKSVTETAKVLGCDYWAVTQLTKRAIKQLRKL